MKVCVIGCGSVGTRHIENLLALGVPSDDVSVLDLIEEKQAQTEQRFGLKPTKPSDNYDAMLICAPADGHARWIKEAVSRKIPFFVEKPATLYLHELTLVEWETDIPNLVGCNMRWRPELRDLRQKFYGKVGVLVQMSCRADMATWPGKTYADSIYELCHEIDLAQWVLGCKAELRSAERKGSQWTLWLWHGDQSSMSCVTLDGASKRFDRRWSAQEMNELGRWRFKEEWWDGVPDDVNQMYLDEMAHFIRVVKGFDRSVNPLYRAKSVVEICLRAVETAISF